MSVMGYVVPLTHPWAVPEPESDQGLPDTHRHAQRLRFSEEIFPFGCCSRPPNVSHQRQVPGRAPQQQLRGCSDHGEGRGASGRHQGQPAAAGGRQASMEPPEVRRTPAMAAVLSHEQQATLAHAKLSMLARSNPGLLRLEICSKLNIRMQLFSART